MAESQPTKYVAYLRTTESEQHDPFLSLEGQRASVEKYVRDYGGEVVGWFEEVSDAMRPDPPALAEAVRWCGRRERATLLVTRVDRLPADSLCALGVIDKVHVVACDIPPAQSRATSKFILQTLVAINVLQHEMAAEQAKAVRP